MATTPLVELSTIDPDAIRQLCLLQHDYDDAAELAALVAENSMVVQSGHAEVAALIRQVAVDLISFRYRR